MPRSVAGDGVLASEIIVEDGIAHRRHLQPSRTAILEFNRELRKSPAALDNLSFAGWELSIPEADYKMWIELIPDLDSTDRETKLRAWKKFLATEWADPYRVRERARKGGIS